MKKALKTRVRNKMPAEKILAERLVEAIESIAKAVHRLADVEEALVASLGVARDGGR